MALCIIGVALSVAGCGGGGGGGGATAGGSGSIPDAPTVSVVLAPAAQTKDADEIATATTFSFTAQVGGASSAVLYPNVQFDRTQLTQVGTIISSGGNYTASFRTGNALPEGTHSGIVTFRLCQDQSCATVVPESSKVFTYTLNVPSSDWVTLQRNAAHTGYVPRSYDGSAIRPAWTFRPADAARLSAVASRGASVFVTQFNSDRSYTVKAIDSTNGALRWARPIPLVTNLGDVGPPAVYSNRVAVPTLVTSSYSNENLLLDAATGQVARRASFAAQWSKFAPLTPYQDDLFMAAGYMGETLYRFDGATGNLRWMDGAGEAQNWDGQTPAVDANYVYYNAGRALWIYNREVRGLVATIADPEFSHSGYGFQGAPMLGSHDNVISVSGSSRSPNAIPQPRPLVSFSVPDRAIAWRSAAAYTSIPAISRGMIYATTLGRVDAIAEDSGRILWSWTPPAGETFEGAYGNNATTNVVITNNLLFVSTDKRVYALSLTDPAHAPVWSADTPGEMAITGDNLLVIAVRAFDGSKNKLVAYQLR